jgi:hypothetical protein
MLVRVLATLIALAVGAIAAVGEADAGSRSRGQTRERDGWVLLGTRSVDLKKESDRIDVGAGKGRFTSLMIVGVDRPIDVRRVTVTTDGDRFIQAERMKLAHGQRSEPIRFSHEGRVIRQVDLGYRVDFGAGGPANIEVWGLPASYEPRVSRLGAGWVWIATRSVDLDKEEDRIEVGPGKGRFKSLMLVGVDRPIDIYRVAVTSEGEPFVRAERMRLERGARSKPIKFSHEGRSVRHVDLSYRLHLGAAGPANVELWGLRTVADGPPVARIEPPTRAEPPRSAAAPIQPSRTTGPVAPAAAAEIKEETDGAGAVLFGIHDIASSGDSDVFKLGREYGRFGRVRLRALGNSVRLKEMQVIYTAGQPDVLAFDGEVPTDAPTAWLNLKGDRFIREIHFVYANPSRSKARLEVYGEYADSWFRPGSGTGAFSSANNGWLYLGGQSPLFVSIRRGLGYETDTVSVARNRGFKNLRLDVKNRAITLNQIKVIYSDGSADIFGQRQKVDGGTSFGPVELSRRPVRQIEISYRSRFFDSNAQGSGYAFVEFWAK